MERLNRAWAWCKAHPKQALAIALVVCNIASAAAHRANPKAGRVVDSVIPMSLEEFSKAVGEGPQS